MARNKIIIIAVCILLLACLMIFVKPMIAKMGFDEKAFAVENTQDITKIILSNTIGNKSELTKENGVWMINHQYKCREKVIESLLNTIKNVRADYPVSKSGHNNVMKMLVSFNTRVEIYTNSKTAVKTYYVGGANVTGDGTFMIMENNHQMAKRPYVTKVLGVSGALTPYYIADPKPWRSRELFAYAPKDIKNISLSYPAKMDASFSIDNSGSAPRISPISSTLMPVGIAADSMKLFEYLSYFEKTFAENYVNEYQHIDTLKATTPYCIMKISDKNNKVNTLTIYSLPTNERSKTQYDRTGNKVTYDSDRFIGLVNDGKDFVLIQYYVFGKYFKRYQQFFNNAAAAGGTSKK